MLVQLGRWADISKRLLKPSEKVRCSAAPHAAVLEDQLLVTCVGGEGARTVQHGLDEHTMVLQRLTAETVARLPPLTLHFPLLLVNKNIPRQIL